MDEDIKEIMENYDLDEEQAKNFKEKMDEWGLDEDEAWEIFEEEI